MQKLQRICACLALACMVLCGPALTAPTAEGAAKKNVTLVYVEWDCATASSYLVQAALEDRLGITVELLPVSAAAMWAAVASGDADASVTAWLPATHASYAKKLQGRFEDLGPLVTGARLGWAVPDYVTVTSMKDVAAHAAAFKNTVTGIDAGAGIMELSEKAMKTYGLDGMVLQDGSGATMAAALGDAIRRKEWIVVTAWSPHWMFGRWNLRYLDDPEKTLGGSEGINTIVRQGLKKDMPEVHAFLDTFHYNDIGQLQTLMAWNQEKGADLAANARRFMKENPDLADSWFK
ncbi:Substrate binding domain of ABC-type glycine betaine transport system family protein [uncultured delta proteobacterium]|uniref:Substrate binding domain of ABC-type glycine betaine transport system family protein n=1 Tax=uncultured delta proteobacterium TaxID=34034 RepID=A0A212KCG9_9DELT|nr:Substrate binding domain of ABC-type glycine betaine transport system family protein [uncultured delta proteobacterium]